jgi:hypothetical protein
MKKENKILYFVIVIIFFLVAFLLVKNNRHIAIKPEDIKSVNIAGQNIKVDLALTEAEQTQGLSGRTSLNENEGMLFVFPVPGKYAFWMKDMNFPIDMIWLAPSGGGDREAKVVYIKKNADPKLYPETYGPGPSDGEAKYVLEVVSGFSDKNNLKVGDSVYFSGIL